MDEFELIRRFFDRPSTTADLGVGDDAALIQVQPGYQLAISTDMLVEGRHFFPDVDPYALGHKVLAVNLSDLAAMGAQPRYATLAIGIPRVEIAWLEAFSAGFFNLAKQYGVELIGGDTTRSAEHVFSVTIMGEVPTGAALRRDGAKVGDDIWVSGELGTAALGLLALKRPDKADQLKADHTSWKMMRMALEQPNPQVLLGQKLRGLVHACMDVSDGLLGDLPHILECSRVGGAVVGWEMIPCHPKLKDWLYGESSTSRRHALKALLAGGDDYQLLFTAPSEHDALIRALAQQLNIRLTPIGKICADPGLFIVSNEGELLEAPDLPSGGFNHFQ
jgi:thiamine-monophosphate kinase